MVKTLTGSNAMAGLPRLDVRPGTVFFVVVMIGTVTFDGFSQGQIWKDVSVDLAGVIDGIVPEPAGGAHTGGRDPRSAGSWL